MRLVRLALAVLLAAQVALLAGSTPAQAADTIRDQWYVKPTGLAALKAKGLNGAGLTIAVIDGGVPDLTVPELRGIQVKKVVKPCTDKPSAFDREHTTNVSSLLASPDYGWAPKAQYLFYVKVTKEAPDIDDRSCVDDRTYTYAWAVNDAINRGADLITIQILSTGGAELDFALIRAAEKGIPVICGMGNDNKREFAVIGSRNLVVGVGASDASNRRVTFSSWGPGLSLIAPGTGIVTRGLDTSGKLSQIRKWYGTSYSAPMVAGAMALAMQAWPNAHGNQLVRSMLVTATRPGNSYSEDIGWGSLNAAKFVAYNPSKLSKESPLKQKSSTETPTPQDYRDYVDGMVLPDDIAENDTEYVYRGDVPVACKVAHHCEFKTSPQLASASPSPAPEDSSAAQPNTKPPYLVMLIAGGVVVLIAIAVTVVVTLRRQRARTAASDISEPTSPPPPPGPPAL